MRSWVGLSKTEIDTRCDTRLLPVPPTDVPPVCGDGRLRAQSSRLRSAFRALDLANCMIHPSSICRRNQNAHTEEGGLADNKI